MLLYTSTSLHFGSKYLTFYFTTFIYNISLLLLQVQTIITENKSTSTLWCTVMEGGSIKTCNSDTAGNMWRPHGGWRTHTTWYNGIKITFNCLRKALSPSPNGSSCLILNCCIRADSCLRHTCCRMKLLSERTVEMCGAFVQQINRQTTQIVPPPSLSAPAGGLTPRAQLGSGLPW